MVILTVNMDFDNTSTAVPFRNVGTAVVAQSIARRRPLNNLGKGDL